MFASGHAGISEHFMLFTLGTLDFSAVISAITLLIQGVGALYTGGASSG